MAAFVRAEAQQRLKAPVRRHASVISLLLKFLPHRREGGVGQPELLEPSHDAFNEFVDAPLKRRDGHELLVGLT